MRFYRKEHCFMAAIEFESKSRKRKTTKYYMWHFDNEDYSTQLEMIGRRAGTYRSVWLWQEAIHSKQWWPIKGLHTLEQVQRMTEQSAEISQLEVLVLTGSTGPIEDAKQ